MQLRITVFGVGFVHPTAPICVIFHLMHSTDLEQVQYPKAILILITIHLYVFFFWQKSLSTHCDLLKNNINVNLAQKTPCLFSHFIQVIEKYRKM